MSTTAADIRETFLSYFEKQGHTRIRSSSLIPEGDATLLFTNAGMNQFKRVFTGEEQRDYKRATSSQKCVRAGGKHNDLENVGFTARHHTFFEMLGNFSFGDYFKSDAIKFAWELITKEYGLPTDKLWVTVYKDDDEAEELWKKVAGVSADRIRRYGEKDNFWAMGDTGPCGPCSEIHFDQGDALEGTLNGEGDRYLEIWNLVFMQFDRDESGRLTPLTKTGIDTGMGLERISAILQGKLTNYDTDLFSAVLESIPGSGDRERSSLNVIADHARATAFLIADGVLPSNLGRGYVLRRIMRRAIRHGVKLDLDDVFFWKVANRVIDVMSDVYPELEEQRGTIEKVARKEEEQFRKTLKKGLRLLNDAIKKLDGKGAKVVDGDTVFLLYGTHGFPPDLTEVIAREYGMSIDWDGYQKLMEAESQSGVDSWGGGEQLEAPANLRAELSTVQEAGSHEIHEPVADILADVSIPTGEFDEDLAVWLGRDRAYDLTARSPISALLKLTEDGTNAELVSELEAGDTGGVLTWWSPFYPEGGGQVGDRGTIESANGTFEVQDTQKLSVVMKHNADVPIHLGRVTKGTLRTDEAATLSVAEHLRAPTRIHHTATHLVHAALRNQLGTHVKQGGSHVSADRLRFDFSHFEQVTKKQLRMIEDEVNTQIWRQLDVTREEMTYDQAVEAGALAFFGDKYGSKVWVCAIGGYSKEFCGGTHTHSTGEIGYFRLVSEEGIAAGTRRIEALAGPSALVFDQNRSNLLEQTGLALKVKPTDVPERVTVLLDENKKLLKEIERLKAKAASAGASSLVEQARDIGGVKVLSSEVEGVDGKALRTLAEELRTKLGSGIVVLGTANDGKVSLVATVTKDLSKKHSAGDLIKTLAPMVGGKGGGRPEMASGGGTDASGLPKALEHVFELVAG